MESFEKLGAFYLGRPYDLSAGKPGEGYLLYDSKELTTHAVCVGMTGSGKTGLCASLLEEAAMDGIPAIVIDPKGDMANLLLTFPDLLPEDFLPWIDEGEARRKELSTEEFARQQAEKWKAGLASWGQDGDRIRLLRERSDFALYTPGSSAARPISILRSFSCPPAAVLEDGELLREQAAVTSASLLGLIGEDADPVRSRQHILLTTLVLDAWGKGMDLDLAGIIQLIQKPPFTQVGVMDLESFYPSKERFELALQFNSLLASPSFASWLQGEPLDIDRLLYTQDGRPRISILSIAHLSDTERMFFVSLLLGQVIAWMRMQSGTGSLRAILYMDEIHGYFPPVVNPPSKSPMLTLLRQARAFGLGIVLTTQNPVDLDYKGLSNTGTWFIGRLQTERDKARVLEGLEGASTVQGSEFDRAGIERILSGLGNRVFLMHNVHDDSPTVFETRWCMSYLRGPMTRMDFIKLKALQGDRAVPEPAAVISGPAAAIPLATVAAAAPQAAAATSLRTSAPSLPPDVRTLYLPVRGRLDASGMVYRPALLGIAKVGFHDTRAGIHADEDMAAITPLTDAILPADWEDAQTTGLTLEEMETAAREGVPMAALPPAAAQAKSYTAWSREFADWVFRTRSMEVFHAPALKQFSQPGETERDFRIRIQLQVREQKDAGIEVLRKKYAVKIASLTERIRKSEQAVEREKEQAKQQKMQTAISFGATLLSSFLGNKKVNASSVSRATTTIRGASRAMKESSDVARSKETVEAMNEQLEALEEEFRKESDALALRLDPQNQPVETRSIRALKRDVQVRLLALAWLPYRVDANGVQTPAWE